MARFVTGSVASAFGQGLFGGLSSKTTEYLKSELNQIAAGGSFREKLYERSVALFEGISSSSANQAAHAVLMQAESAMGLDIIEPLLTIEEIQGAKPIMQNMIMCHPTIYQAYADGKIEAFADTWVDTQPGLFGEERAEWQHINHGVWREHETMSYVASYYTDHNDSDNAKLNIRQLAAIFDSQQATINHIEAGEEDPTSQYGATL